MSDEYSDDDIRASVFEERAEFLSRQELLEWSTETEQDRAILAKLEGPGAKLISGPRGSGKSTLLRKAYFNLLDNGKVLVAYVNCSTGMALEPLFYSHSNALQIFRQWLVFKIILGVEKALTSLKKAPPNSFSDVARNANIYVEVLGLGKNAPDVTSLSPDELVSSLESWAKELGYRRTVLLLDDAAHAFSAQQQKEFFEVFRGLRSRTVSPKAAVYPGITSYGPNLHVGHDAELVEAWYHPETPEYLESMKEMVNKRLPPGLVGQLHNKEELLELLALASFGLPRGLLAMLSSLLGIDEERKAKPNRQTALRVIEAHSNIVMGVFASLRLKLPRLENFVETGERLVHGMTNTLEKANRRNPEESKIIVALAEPLDPPLARVLNLLEYAGVIRAVGSFSRGHERAYKKFALHYSIVVASNALALGTGSVKTLVQALTKTSYESVVQTRGSTILGADYAESCKISLAPCAECGAPRTSEQAKFCVNCGRPLSDQSVYNELLSAPIELLPLTPRKIQGLLEYTQIRTVQDVLLDEDRQEVRKVPYVGDFWAKRIQTAAEEFVSV